MRTTTIFVAVAGMLVAVGCGDDDGSGTDAGAGLDASAADAGGGGGLDGGGALDGGPTPAIDGGGGGSVDAGAPGDGGGPRDAGGRPDAGASGAIVVDHTSVALFERIPATYRDAARDTDMFFCDRSVGDNINTYLDCFTAASYGAAPASCRRDWTSMTGSLWTSALFSQADYDAGRVPARIRFTPDAAAYDRSRWDYDFCTGTWSEIVRDFVTTIAPARVGAYDVLSFQFSYLNIMPGDSIDDAADGFFADLSGAGRFDISDVEALEAANPGKTFVYWTTSLARGIGSYDGEQFNAQMRAYAASHGKVLFDVADIESHDDMGRPCVDNADGVEYCATAMSCENVPDDGVAYEAICQDWTSEHTGGHLGNVSGGGIRIAKAFWVLMARIAGWDGT